MAKAVQMKGTCVCICDPEMWPIQHIECGEEYVYNEGTTVHSVKGENVHVFIVKDKNGKNCTYYDDIFYKYFKIIEHTRTTPIDEDDPIKTNLYR